MRLSVLLAVTSLAAPACSLEGGNREAAATNADRGTTVRLARDGARLEAEGAGIRVGGGGIEIDLDRDVELNVGELRARVRAGPDGSLAISADSE